MSDTQLQEPFKKCRVIWQDAFQDNGWHSHDEIIAHVDKPSLICDTLGWLVYRDDSKIVLAMSINEYRAEGLITIPAGMALKVIWLDGAGITL